MQPNAQQPTPMETQNDPPAPDGPHRGNSTKLQDTKERSRSRDAVAEGSSGPQPPPQPPPAPPASPARDRAGQLGSPREQARSMSRSSPISDHTTRTRSRGNNSEMSTTELTGNGRPPPPDQPPRGRSTTRRSDVNSRQYYPPAPQSVPSNVIEAHDMLDLMGMPVPEYELAADESMTQPHTLSQAEMDRSRSRDRRSSSDDRSMRATASHAGTPLGETERLHSRPLSPASTVDYEPHENQVFNEEDRIPRLPVAQPITCEEEEDDDDDDPAPPGASAAASHNKSQKREPDDDKGADRKKHRGEPDEGPFAAFRTAPLSTLAQAPSWRRNANPTWSGTSSSMTTPTSDCHILDSLKIRAPLSTSQILQRLDTIDRSSHVPSCSVSFPIVCHARESSERVLSENLALAPSRNGYHDSADSAYLCLDENLAKFCMCDSEKLDSGHMIEILFMDNNSDGTKPNILYGNDDLFSETLHLQTPSDPSQSQECLQYHGVVQREFDALTEPELLQHADELQKSRLTEITKLFRLQCFRRIPRHEATNLLDSRWIYKWKKIDGSKAIKSRITLRGFKEKSDYQTYAGTAARCTQRIVNSLAMMNPHFVLQAWDIGSAFAQGLSFTELAHQTGKAARSVQLEIDAADVELIRSQP
eukprot:3489052-Amphidinium_carterae.1